MRTLQEFFSSDLLQSFGWTIIHSLWIGGILFLISWGFLYVFRNSKANIRYLISLGSLFLFFIAVGFTFFFVYHSKGSEIANVGSKADTFFNFSLNILQSNTNSNNPEQFSSFFPIKSFINKNIPLLVVIWFFGLGFFSIRFLGGLVFVHRLRIKSTKTKNQGLITISQKIKNRLGMTIPIQLKESAFISTPMVIGFIKPVILLPIGMANGLPIQQVEAILFHETAHIYRFDFLVNLFQSMVEVIFFYHPLVWWLSSNITSERENICDDIAISYTENALDYAKALINLQELKNQSPAFAMAFSNKKNRFMNRIRRLIGLPQIKNNIFEGIISSLLIVSSIILFSFYSEPAIGNTNTTNTEQVIQEQNPSTINDDKLVKLENEVDKTIHQIEHNIQQIKENEKLLQIKLEENKKTKGERAFTDEEKKEIKRALHNKEEQINELAYSMNKQKDYLELLNDQLKKNSNIINTKQIDKINSQIAKSEQMVQQSQEQLKNQQSILQEISKRYDFDADIEYEKLIEQEIKAKETYEKMTQAQMQNKEEKLMQADKEFEAKKDGLNQKELKKYEQMKREEYKKQLAFEISQEQKVLANYQSELLEKEKSFKLFAETFHKNLSEDKLLSSDMKTKVVLTEKELTINGNVQSKKLFKKYSKLYKKLKGDTLKDGKQMILNF